MHITLVDDGIPFDGLTPPARPLGTAEKAFASLPDALARRGHQVHVFNRCQVRLNVDGAIWETWQAPRPERTDVLIAFRKPELLHAVASADRRILWLADPAAYLARPANREVLAAVEPTLVFLGPAHRDTWSRTPDLPAEIVAPGLRRQYLEDDDVDGPFGPADGPVAVATTHPLHGLDWLVDLWVERVHPKSRHATLHLFSAVLNRGDLGAEVAPPFRPVLAKTLDAREHGVRIRPPGADPAMAAAYRGARAHLYPGSPREVYCGTLAESQAAGLPAVARPGDAVRERVVDGETGLLAPDAETFAAAALRLLNDDEAHARFGAAARDRRRGRSWDDAAADFEALWRDGGR